MVIRFVSTLILCLAAATFLSCGSDANETSQTEPAAKQNKSLTDRPAPKTQPKPTIRPAPEPKQETVQPKEGPKPVANTIKFAVYDTKGELRQSDEWIGKQPVVVNVWGTWCPPCRREIPDLVRLYGEYHEKGIEMLGMAVAARDTPQKVEGFAAQNNMKWVMLMAENHHLYSLRVTTGVPTTIFYDRAGNEVNRFVGPRGYTTFKRAFESIL
jgi:thiol-disulfide isomerase/thioredoxin